MRKIKVSDLIPGMRFTKTVYIDPNNILVGPKVSIQKKHIERLEAWGIRELETAGDVVGTVPEETYENEGLDGEKDVSPELMAAPPVEVDGKPFESIEPVKQDYVLWHIAVKNFFNNSVQNHPIEQEKLKKTAIQIIEKTQEQKNEMVGLVRDFRYGEYLYSHCVNVAVLAALLGTALHMNDEMLQRLVMGCLVIDIGMTRIPSYIMQKEGSLSQEEYKKVQTHPLHAYKIIVQENGLPHEVGTVALEHHEQCDGQGYPRKLGAEQISLFGKVGAIVDSYEAMTKKRSYRDRILSYEAMQQILSIGQQKYDQELLSVFLRQMGIYPIGSYVRLNNNAVGIVAAADPEFPMRPKVKILRDEFGDMVMEEEFMELAKEADIFIVKALNEAAIKDLKLQE